MRGTEGGGRLSATQCSRRCGRVAPEGRTSLSRLCGQPGAGAELVLGEAGRAVVGDVGAGDLVGGDGVLRGGAHRGLGGAGVLLVRLLHAVLLVGRIVVVP